MGHFFRGPYFLATIFGTCDPVVQVGSFMKLSHSHASILQQDQLFLRSWKIYAHVYKKKTYRCARVEATGRFWVFTFLEFFIATFIGALGVTILCKKLDHHCLSLCLGFQCCFFSFFSIVVMNRPWHLFWWWGRGILNSRFRICNCIRFPEFNFIICSLGLVRADLAPFDFLKLVPIEPKPEFHNEKK